MITFGLILLGVTKVLQSAGDAAEKTSAANKDTESLDSDGFTVGTPTQAGGINAGSCVAWNWKANGGTTSSNTSGSVTTTVQANTTAGFSIVTYTGDGNVQRLVMVLVLFHQLL